MHAKVLSELPDVEIAACADPVTEKAAALAEKYGCRSYSSTEEMLDREMPDAVHLCTPHYLHTPHALYAAERGIAVFSEKPPVISPEQLEQLKKAAEKVPVSVCFQNRTNPSVRFIRKALEESSFGRLLGLRAFVTWSRGGAYYENNWRGSFSTEGGGALINQAIHTLDLAVYLLGMPDITEAAMANRHLRGVIETEDTAEIYLKKGDVPALLYVSTAACADAPVLFEVTCEKAVLRAENDRVDIIRPEGTESMKLPEDERLGKSYWGAGHKACISNFYECLKNGTEAPSSLRLCENTLRVMLNIYSRCRDSLPAK